MSQLIYQKDSYIKDFPFTITSISLDENALILDKTAFFPGGGGQPCDLGTIGVGDTTYNVIKVKKIGDEIYHYIEGALPSIGDEGIGYIDFDRRYKLMRTHTALHILATVAYRDYGAQVTGGNMDPLSGRLDFELENFHKELVEDLEESINKEVLLSRPIKVYSLNREEAFKIPALIKTKINLLPQGIEEIRIVEIEGLDIQADGGTHVSNTKEVGKIKVASFKSKGKINKRIYIEIEP